MKSTKINAPAIIAGSFIGVIVLGAILLSLPMSTVQDGSMPLLDALFTSTSAVCVTGLTVVDTGTAFTKFGQIVILGLIQIGGLGIMTLSTFFLVLLGKRLQMKDLFVIEGSLGQSSVQGVKGLVKYCLFATIGIEVIGALVLFLRFFLHYDFPLARSIYYAFFHSISAFCNAGFALFPDNLCSFRQDWIVLCVIAFLIIFGGLGFVVLLNVNSYKFWEKNRLKKGKLRLHTKIVLLMTIILLFGGAIGFLALEWNGTLRGLPLHDKLTNSFFQSTTPRTAGYNALVIGDMSQAALCLTLFLMFVGGAPGSTAGGIKVSTFMVLLVNAYGIIKGKIDLQLFNRTIPKRVVQEATCVLAISTGIVFICTMGLLISERDFDFMKITYEAVSAFANVGLSTGITPDLSNIGKSLIIILMFVGRISPLTMALVVGRKEEYGVIRYPMESVMVG